MIRRPPRSTQGVSSAASDVYKRQAEVGRLATSVNNQPEVFPVNYVVDGQSIVFRTAAGSKLEDIVTNNRVAFEADGWTEEAGWSVVLRGKAEIITDDAELALCDKMPLLPWVPTVKRNYVRVEADQITGRTFASVSYTHLTLPTILLV